MSLIPLASKGNFFHIYDFRVKPGTGEQFVSEFEQFDYSDENPMHKSSAQVKDGVMLRDTTDPDHFFLSGEWADIEVHAGILNEMDTLKPSFVQYIEDLDKGAFAPLYAEIVSSTPQHILDGAAEAAE